MSVGSAYPGSMSRPAAQAGSARARSGASGQTRELRARGMLTQFTRVLYQRIAEVAPADLDAAVASLALVAMLERLNYYVLSRQVRVDRDAMIDTLARVMHASLFGP